jgi:GAF domain-containing protein
MEQLEQRDAVRILQCQSAAIAAFPDQERVMSVVAEGACEVAGATFAVVEMLEGDELVYRSVAGLGRGLLGSRLKAWTSLSGLCVREGQLLYCEDTETDERVDREATRRLGAGSMIIAPLRHGERVVGVLKAGAQKARSFGERERRVVSILAGMLSTILARSVEQEIEQRSSALLADAFM